MYNIYKMLDMCVWGGAGVEYLTFDILLLVKFEKKVIGNYFFTPIIFKNLLKTGFSLRNTLITYVSGVFGF